MGPASHWFESQGKTLNALNVSLDKSFFLNVNVLKIKLDAVTLSLDFSMFPNLIA